MQSAVSDDQATDLCLSSSGSSSAEHENPSGWSQPRPPPIPAKPGFVVHHGPGKSINAMASAQSHHNGSSLGLSEDDHRDDKRISSATVFEEVSPIGEGLIGVGGSRKQPLNCTMSAPLGEKRQSKMPAPPPDMDDIE